MQGGQRAEKQVHGGQIVAALREHEAGTSAKELCRRLGIATETLYNWKRKYGGMDASEPRKTSSKGRPSGMAHPSRPHSSRRRPIRRRFGSDGFMSSRMASKTDTGDLEITICDLKVEAPD